MQNFVEALGRIHPEQEVFIRHVLLIPHQGVIVVYDAGNEEWLANIVAGMIRWAHPVDYDVTRLAERKPVAPDENIGSCEPSPLIRWDKSGTTWHTDTKAGRYSVQRIRGTQAYSAFLNNAVLTNIKPGRVDEVKRAVEHRIQAARRIAAMPA